MTRSRLATIVILLTLWSMPAQADGAKTHVGHDRGSVLIEGSIGAHHVYLMKNIPDDFSGDVILNSPGGLESAALDVAEEIVRRRLSVVVRGRCASACAQYLLVAGKHRRAEANAVIGFHGNMAWWNARAGDLFEGDIEMSRVAKQLTERANALYDRMGVDPEFMVMSGDMVRPVCFRKIEGRRGLGAYRAETVARVWSMGPEDFKRFGIEVDGLWNDYDEWRARLAALALPGADKWVYVVFKPASTQDGPEISIPICSPDMLEHRAAPK